MSRSVCVVARGSSCRARGRLARVALALAVGAAVPLPRCVAAQATPADSGRRLLARGDSARNRGTEDDLLQAIAYWSQARAFYHTLGNRDGESAALNQIGLAFHTLRKVYSAFRYL